MPQWAFKMEPCLFLTPKTAKAMPTLLQKLVLAKTLFPSIVLGSFLQVFYFPKVKHKKAKYQRLNDLTFLLESGDNVNQSDKNGNTVLHYLVRHRSPMAKEAIYAGAEINKANKDGETPYFWAVRYGTVETRAMLLSLGANPDILNKAGKKANEYNYVTSFNDAVRNKDYKVIKSILVNYPSLVNDFLYNGLSLVGFAIVNKNNDLLKLLLNFKNLLIT